MNSPTVQHRLCTVDGCGHRLLARSLCNRHYRRLRRHGSPLAGGKFFRQEDESYTTADTAFIDLCNGHFAMAALVDYPLLTPHLWHISSNGYAQTSAVIEGKRQHIHMHRLIMAPPPGFEVDHINGDKLDNRRCNLRICRRWQNHANRKKSGKRTSQYKGVSWRKDRRKWVSRICLHRDYVHLGFHDSEIDAAISYNVAALELFGPFARLNDLRPGFVLRR